MATRTPVILNTVEKTLAIKLNVCLVYQLLHANNCLYQMKQLENKLEYLGL